MINPYDYYITDEEYAIAEKNGICRDTLNFRIRRMGWEKEKALITPPRARNDERTNRRTKDIDRETLLTLLNNNYNYNDIAKELRVSKSTVFNYIAKFKIKKIYKYV